MSEQNTASDSSISRKIYLDEKEVESMLKANQSLDIGIDFGGVLSIHASNDVKGGEHRRFDIDMPEAIESLKKLKEQGHRLHLISFCGNKRAQQTAASLKNQCDGLFYSLFFVRNKKFKGAVCKMLGCDIMIDDRPEVLKSVVLDVPTIVPILFTGDPSFTDSGNNKCPVNDAASWKEIVELINRLSFTKHYSDDKVSLENKLYSIID
jgi:hypothetical protein